MNDRINLHKDDKSELHCMIIYKKKDDDTPIMCHPHKDMVFILLRGTMLFKFYDEHKNVYREETFNEHTNQVILIPKKTYYKMHPISDIQFVEVNKGPFNIKTHNRYLNE